MSTSDYYLRKETNIDGRKVFISAEDEKEEAAVAKLVEAAFECTLHKFGRMAAIDWFA